MRILLFTLALSATFIGCAESDSASTSAAEPVNAECPIMGGDVTTEGGTVQWNGKTVGFCCPGCDEKWAKLLDDEKAEKLAAAM